MPLPEQQWVCLNGAVLPAHEATVSVFDAGLLQGIGLFTTAKARHGRVFRLPLHIERLRRSVEAFGWTHALDTATLIDDTERLLLHSRLADARIRITITVGSLHAAENAPPTPTTLISAAPEQRYPAELYERGCSVLLSNCRQSTGDPLAGHKTTSYFGRLTSLRAAHTQGAFEALWLTPDDHVAEAAISNLFVVRDDGLLTPPLDTPVLPGIARATVLALAPALDISVRERALTIDELESADEIFLTNSMMDVMPVVRIGRKQVANEKVGEITRTLMSAYGELIEAECGDG